MNPSDHPARRGPGLLTRVAQDLSTMWRHHKWYFIAPIVITAGALALLVWLLGPQAVVAFIYAGS